MIKKLSRILKSKNAQLSRIDNIHSILDNDIKSPKVNLGKIQATLNRSSNIRYLRDIEFQVFSQWGDDGIIQYLIDKINIPNKTFIEFGVENYKEANTRFLLINNNWSGYVIDGGKDNIEYIKKDSVFWAFDIHAKCAFITKDNINKLLSEFIKKGYDPEIGILSIDIDGNDLWVWKEINVVSPIIVIVEYNAVLGIEKAWSIPYKEDFYRHDAHDSFQYWGASLKAFYNLGQSKGYAFLGCNGNGNNAYFVRRDKLGGLRELTLSEGFVDSKFREYVDARGERVGGRARLDLIKGMPMYNAETDKIENI